MIDKIYEEIEEVRTEIEHNGSADRLEDEVGDLLFVCVNLARKLSVEPEGALRRANRKFERRFRVIEEELRFGRQNAGPVQPVRNGSALDACEASRKSCDR